MDGTVYTPQQVGEQLETSQSLKVSASSNYIQMLGKHSALILETTFIPKLEKAEPWDMGFMRYGFFIFAIVIVGLY